MAITANRRAVSASLLLVAMLLILPGCDRPRITRETPEANPPAASPTSSTSVLPTVLAEPPVTPGYSIDRIAIATEISDADAPMPEVAVIPESARQFYLCVKADGLPPGARFRAYWLEDGQIIGQSDKISIETEGRPVWVALEYHPPFPLNPALDHAVELLINDQRIDRYVVRIGSGDASEAVAEAAFAARFNSAGQPVGVKTRFPLDTAELTLQVRISNRVDPTGMALAALWYRGDTQVAELPPDPAPDPQATPTAASTRQFAFTWTPGAALTPGDYRVVVLLNGNEARTVPFVVLDAAGNAPPASASPSSSPQRSATGTQVKSASIKTAMVTEHIDPNTNEPLDGRVRYWEASEGSTVELWVAIQISALTTSDVVDVLVSRDGELFASDRIPAQALSSGWVALPVRFEVPAVAEGDTSYEIVALLNGTNAGSAELTITPVEE